MTGRVHPPSKPCCSCPVRVHYPCSPIDRSPGSVEQSPSKRLKSRYGGPLLPRPPTIEQSETEHTVSTTSADYRRTYQKARRSTTIIDALEAARLAEIHKQMDFAREHTDTIRAAQAITCQDPRFTHFINNQLICARCDQTTDQILEGKNQ